MRGGCGGGGRGFGGVGGGGPVEQLREVVAALGHAAVAGLPVAQPGLRQGRAARRAGLSRARGMDRRAGIVP